MASGRDSRREDPTPTMGEVLRDTRYRLGVSLEQIEYDTHVRKKYLLALEEDDYASLPAPVYARGFLEIYSEYLGLDPAPLLKLYQPPARTVAAQGLRPAATGMSGRPSIGLRGLMSFVLSALGLVSVIYLYAQYLDFASNQSETLPSAAAARPPTPTASAIIATPRPGVGPVVGTGVPVASPTPTTTPLPTPSPTPVRSVEVVVQVVERSWVRVIADGQSPPIFEGELYPGDLRTWRARDRIDMRVGNAGGVEVTVNGMRQGRLGASGEVKNVSWGRQ